jgi:hypothetical protein
VLGDKKRGGRKKGDFAKILTVEENRILISI